MLRPTGGVAKPVPLLPGTPLPNRETLAGEAVGQAGLKGGVVVADELDGRGDGGVH